MLRVSGVLLIMTIVGGWTSMACAATRQVASAAELEQAVESAAPGDEVLIASGQYADWRVELAGKGGEGKPIIVRPAEVGGVIFTGHSQIVLTGEHVELHGLRFEEVVTDRQSKDVGIVIFRGSRHCRLTDTIFTKIPNGEWGAAIWFTGAAADNRLDHCKFIDIHIRGVSFQISSVRHGPPVRNRIDHNLFMDIPRLRSNGGETIQIGSRAYPYANLEAHTLIEDNTFLRCDGDSEIISVKSTANTIRNNRFLHCRGEVTLRHGGGNTIQDNLMFDCSSGVRVSGPDQVVTGNTIIAPRAWGILITYGTPDLEHPAAYLPVTGGEFTGNTIVGAPSNGIEVGVWKDRAFHSELWSSPRYNASEHMELTEAPSGNVITGNTIIGEASKLLTVHDAPDNRIEGNILIESPAKP